MMSQEKNGGQKIAQGPEGYNLKEYRERFAKDHLGPYALQWPGNNWKTRYKPVSDPLLQAHLEGKYWVAVRASWYPTYFFLDIDSPNTDTVDKIVEVLRLREGQYKMMTSPSYSQTGNLHLVVKPEYKNKRVTHRLGYEALRNSVGKICEVYPQLKRKFRLPLGKGQFLLGSYGEVQDFRPWWESLYWIEKIDPLEVDTLSFQPELPFPNIVKKEDHPRRWRKSKEIEELYEEGLQAFGTRHSSTWDLALSLWRANFLPKEAVEVLKKWIRKKHNRFSKTINSGNFKAVDDEIARQVQWIWGNFRPYPDSPHNLEGYVTLEDLKWIAKVYPCNVVNQKRLFSLICYMRPRSHHDFVYVPHHIWREEVANDRTYQDFLQDLEEKRLLDSVSSYRHVQGFPELSYSRKYKLYLPEAAKEPLVHDNRNEQDYYQAMLLGTGSVREAISLTGVHKQRWYEAILRDKDLNDKE